MAHPGEPLEVDPTDLRVAADRIDGHASDFGAAQEAARSRASSARLGSGLAAAGLPAMVAAWESNGVRFARQFGEHAQGHREAAASYMRTDSESAGGIDGAGSVL